MNTAKENEIEFNPATMTRATAEDVERMYNIFWGAKNNTRTRVVKLKKQNPNMSNAEIARTLSVSRERVGQIVGNTPEKEKKAAARRSVRRSVLSGAIQKMPCKICGNPKAEAHHEDYDKPLDVIWLCKKHHTELRTYATSRTPTGSFPLTSNQRQKVRKDALQEKAILFGFPNWSGMLTAIKNGKAVVIKKWQ